MTTAPGIDPERERPSPFPASDSVADIAAKVAEVQAFFDVSQQTARQPVAEAQQHALMERLKARHAARLAGIWVDNAAGWNVVVRLTGPEPAADETHPGADGPQGVRYITGAALTEAEMQHRLHAQHCWFVPQLPELIGYGLDVMTGELELELWDTAGARATAAAVRDHLQAQLGYPVRLRWHPAGSHLQSR
ncbi:MULTISPECIES: hypothetical protein [Stenotrophomonas]|uniref:hypothetical protein n=1 Tax=Stenotrophomonas TaxID=40323 RepID=UPI0021CACD87|nr:MULTISPECIES: hypothetical protein [Stenotrophomonas]